MSFRAVSMAMAICEGITCPEKLLLLALAERHNKDTDRCDPSVRLLMRDCIMSERTVRKLLASLETKGLIAVDHRFAQNGRQRTNSYRLIFVQHTPPPDAPMGAPGDPPGVHQETPYEGDPDAPLEPREEEPGSEPSLRPAAQAGGGKSPIVRFHEADKRNEQVAALVDIARSMGRDVAAGHLAAMLGRSPPAAILSALMAALAANAARIDTYMEGVLRNGRAKETRGRTRGRTRVATTADLEAAKRYVAGDDRALD